MSTEIVTQYDDPEKQARFECMVIGYIEGVMSDDNSEADLVNADKDLDDLAALMEQRSSWEFPSEADSEK